MPIVLSKTQAAAGKTVPGSVRENLRILVLHNHVVIRRGVIQILAERFGLLEFGEGTAGSEGLDLAIGQPWDLVIVPTNLLDRGGLEVLTELKRIH
jgi:DNA-binding NarL/FixJ family response regulator